MRSGKKPGVIINIGSAAGLYPMNSDPIYSGTKGAYTITYIILIFWAEDCCCNESPTWIII